MVTAYKHDAFVDQAEPVPGRAGPDHGERPSAGAAQGSEIFQIASDVDADQRAG